MGERRGEVGLWRGRGGGEMELQRTSLREEEEGSSSFREAGKKVVLRAREESSGVRPSERRRSQKGAPRRERRAVQAGCAFQGEEGGGARPRGPEELEGDWRSVTSPGGQPRSGEASQGAKGRESL